MRPKRSFLTRRMCPLLAAALLCLTASCGTPPRQRETEPPEQQASELFEIADEAVPLAGGTMVRTPQTGSQSQSGGGATVDYSNAAEGYVLVKYSGGNNKIKVQITRNGGKTYTYDLNTGGQYEVLPLTDGNGTYRVGVYTNVSGTSYAEALSVSVSVSLRDSMLPFLYPSQYVNFSANTGAVAIGAQLAATAQNDLEIVSNVYNYVITNLSYDTYKAQTVQSGYLPNVDSVLSAGKGICFDYSAVMAAMLRSQQIPTRLEVGYVSGGAYHAWISTYIRDVGWINGVIQFDGVNWKLMDPTFASSGGGSESIMQYIGNGSNYSTQYVY